MANPIVIDKISSVSITDLKAPVRIGASVKEMPRSAIKHLPNRLDAQACLEILAKVHPDWTVESIKAAGKQLDVSEVDDCLDYTDLSLLDRITFKSALSQFGIVARGKKVS
jgi:hypothetical protein